MAVDIQTAGATDSAGRDDQEPAVGTVLEGVRAKVFLDRYSLKDPNGKPIEHTPEEMWRRVARGIAAVEATPEARRHWEQEFYRALQDFRFVPGGRILTGAGSGHEVTFYNCFQGDTPVHTRAGIVPIGSLSGTHEVLSLGGVYRPAFFQSFGRQRLWRVVLANGAVVHATGDHQWVVSRPKGGTERVPTRHLLGRRIPINARPAPARGAAYADGVRHGIVFGDGSQQYGAAHVCLFGESEHLAAWFSEHATRSASGTVATKAHVRVQGLPAAWKQLPRPDAEPAYWRGFVAGLIAADGHVDARGSVALYNHDAGVLAAIVDGMAGAGLVASSITMTRATSPYDGSDKPVYRLQFFKDTIEPDDLLLPSHRANLEQSPRARQSTLAVIEVSETDRIEEVFCATEPATHTLTIGHGYLTGNCYVIPSPDDSRGGILDNLKILTEIMARGGGVGVNLSTLRPRGSYIKTVNGTASGPVSWAELYSVITGDVIQQGGSRRGALMIMLDDDHPDVLEFVNAKKIDPLTNRPVAIEHANISVAVSDAFMQAVEADGVWPTQFPTKAMVAADPALAEKITPGPTFRAREIWRRICESAWATAEPGVVFTDRYNAWNNTWYYQTIRCTNPCVTGDTLIYTDQGLRRAVELQAAGEPTTVVIDERFGRGAVAAASSVFPTGVRPVYRLQTREGYYVRATADHRVMTARGWVPMAALQPGDRVHILNHAGVFGTEGSLELGRVLGWLVGDGTVKRDEAVLSFFGPEKQELAPLFARHVDELASPLTAPTARRAYTVGVTTVAGRDEARVASQRLLMLAPVSDMLHQKHRVPETVFRGTEAMQQGFLQALFTADGGMQDGGEKGGSVRLASSHVLLLEGVQQLLLNFGIASTIYRERRSVHLKPMPDGKGGRREYLCAAQHELVISKRNLVTFANRISFLMDEKQAALVDYITRGKRGPYAETFTATVETVSADGVEPVYDLTEPLTHSFIANGIVVHNCGEQGISPWSVCNLAALNLSSFVSGPIGAGTFDYAALDQYVRIGMRFSDNVIDANLYFFEENADEQLGTRRTGLGTMGLADALIRMGIRYGSTESEPVIEQIYRTIRDAAYDESVTLAIEKGAFPRFDADRYGQGKFIRTLPEALQARIRQHGIRNAVILTQAPTGTTSLLAGVSSGIEPVFDFAYRRVDRTGESIIYHPLLKQWMDEHPDADRPDYFVGANDLTPEDHIRVQAMVQRYTDSSISKTCNAPNDHTVEEVERLYQLAYASGCKGVTYYRDGSRDAVLHHIEEKKPAAPEPAPAPVAVVDKTIRPRPAIVQGYTRNMQAPEGKVNITLNSDEQGLLEVFVNVGRAGSDIAALAEALGRLISLLQRIPSPLTADERALFVANQLRGIGGSRTVGFGLEQVRSLPDAIGLALQKHLEGGVTAAAPLPATPVTQPTLPGLLNGHAKLTGNLCPDCGSATLVFEEGCKKCHVCGYSEC